MLCTSPCPSQKHPRNGLKRHEASQKQTTPKTCGRAPKMLRKPRWKQFKNRLGEAQSLPHNGLGEPQHVLQKKAQKWSQRQSKNSLGEPPNMIWNLKRAKASQSIKLVLNKIRQKRSVKIPFKNQVKVKQNSCQNESAQTLYYFFKPLNAKP